MQHYYARCQKCSLKFGHLSKTLKNGNSPSIKFLDWSKVFSSSDVKFTFRLCIFKPSNHFVNVYWHAVFNSLTCNMEMVNPSNSWINQKFFAHRMLYNQNLYFLNHLILLLMFISIQYDAVPRVTPLCKLSKVYTKIWTFK
jgi:hypothetical protein